MRLHFIILATLFVSLFVGCGQHSEQVVLQDGNDSAGQPTKFRNRLAMRFAYGDFDAQCVQQAGQTVAASGNVSESALQAEIKNCPSSSSSGRDIAERGFYWNNYDWYYYYVPYFYNASYYANPLYSGINTLCSGIFGSYAASWGINCANVAGYNNYSYTNYYRPYCSQCASTYNTTCSGCYVY